MIFDSTIHIVGFPMDLGAGRRGVDMGPSALRYAGIERRIRELGYSVVDDGDINVRPQEVQTVKDRNLKYLPEITRATKKLAAQVEEILDKGHFPLVLGGDHSMSIGTLAGLGSWCKKNNRRMGVLWIDAHADMNTPDTTPSGNIHGMPLSVSMGIGEKSLTSIGGEFQKVRPEDVMIIGARSIDQGEREMIRQLGVNVATMYDIDKRGIYPIIQEALDRFEATVDFLHVSFDIDSVDPTVAKGVGTPVPGGLSFREAHVIMESIAERKFIHSLEVAEVNPILDEMNRSAEFAVDVVSSCLGQSIL